MGNYLVLEHLDELGTRQDGLGLLERLNLLITGGLADLEVLHDEVAALVEFGVVVRELLQLKQSVFLVLGCLVQVLLGLCTLLNLVGLRLGLLLDRRVGILDEILVRLLGVLLGADDLSLHGLGIVDDGLDHAHDTAGVLVLLVLLESRRRRLALLDKCCGLLVEALEDVKCCGEQLLRSALIGNDELELLVLLLAVLTTALHVEVELINLRLEGVDLTGEGLDLQLQVLDEGQKILLLGLLALSLHLVGVELIHAPVLVLDLVLLLGGELGD